MVKAYSYVRFSTPEQAKGDSMRRQTAGSDAVAKEFGWTLDETLTLRDLGVSAFKAKNAKVGALAIFLKAVENKTVPAGSVLIVESLDRLTRRDSDRLEPVHRNPSERHQHLHADGPPPLHGRLSQCQPNRPHHQHYRDDESARRKRDEEQARLRVMGPAPAECRDNADNRQVSRMVDAEKWPVHFQRPRPDHEAHHRHDSGRPRPGRYCPAIESGERPGHGPAPDNQRVAISCCAVGDSQPRIDRRIPAQAHGEWQSNARW